MASEQECESCEEYRALHRAYNALVAAQNAGAKNGPEVVKLTDECAAKGVILVPGGEYRPNPKCEKHGEWRPERLAALARCFDVLEEAMTWTRINPEDPKTYPESGKRVLAFAHGRIAGGIWNGALGGWYLDTVTGAGTVTHWQPLPALPGEESESKAEHPASPDKVAIVRAWLGEDNPWEHVDRLLARLEACDSAPTELVERVAKVIYEAKYGTTRSWSDLPEEKRYDFERYARAAIEAIPLPAAPAPAWHDRPTSPGWWLWDANEAFMGWLHLDESQCCNPKYQVGNLYGPVVVPEQEKKL